MLYYAMLWLIELELCNANPKSSTLSPPVPIFGRLEVTFAEELNFPGLGAGL